MTIATAFALDLVAGDPRWLPHPVRVIGAAIVYGEPLARRLGTNDPRREMVSGAAMALSIVAATSGVAAFVSGRSAVADVLLAWTTIAVRDLLAESERVIAALERADLATARRRLARIVGRETAGLDETEIARAVIETLAESACDGIVAPLCALAAGGIPAAFGFKAASTLDSTIGHVEAPYQDFGRAAAKLDDVLCYVPARICAVMICALAPLVRGDSRRAWRTLRADGARHRSPNAGRPEAAMAGALAVRLGGTNVYDGVAHEGAIIGSGFTPPAAPDARRAQVLVVAVAFATVAVAFAATWGLDAP